MKESKANILPCLWVRLCPLPQPATQRSGILLGRETLILKGLNKRYLSHRGGSACSSTINLQQSSSVKGHAGESRGAESSCQVYNCFSTLSKPRSSWQLEKLPLLQMYVCPCFQGKCKDGRMDKLLVQS